MNHSSNTKPIPVTRSVTPKPPIYPSDKGRYNPYRQLYCPACPKCPKKVTSDSINLMSIISIIILLIILIISIAMIFKKYNNFIKKK